MILITAASAKRISNPTTAEELERYETEVTEAIKEAAIAGIKEITLRIPDRLRDDIILQLAKLGYDYSSIGNEGSMSFFKVNWK